MSTATESMKFSRKIIPLGVTLTSYFLIPSFYHSDVIIQHLDKQDLVYNIL